MAYVGDMSHSDWLAIVISMFNVNDFFIYTWHILHSEELFLLMIINFFLIINLFYNIWWHL